jgi:hypothetical protein
MNFKLTYESQVNLGILTLPKLKFTKILGVMTRLFGLLSIWLFIYKLNNRCRFIKNNSQLRRNHILLFELDIFAIEMLDNVSKLLAKCYYLFQNLRTLNSSFNRRLTKD